MQISVIIPAFNEQEVIKQTIEEVKVWLEKNFRTFEIIVVDDGSGDHTLEILKNISGIKLLRSLKNHGKGYTVSKGVRASQGDLILFMDADNSTKITELPKLMPYIKDYSLVIASRTVSGAIIDVSQPKIKVWLGRAGSLLTRLLLRSNIKDAQCGFKLFRKEIKYLFDKLTITGWGFDFELIFLVRKYGGQIKEVPIIWKNHPDSKVGLIGYFKTLIELFKVFINNLFNKY